MPSNFLPLKTYENNSMANNYPNSIYQAFKPLYIILHFIGLAPFAEIQDISGEIKYISQRFGALDLIKGLIILIPSTVLCYRILVQEIENGITMVALPDINEVITNLILTCLCLVTAQIKQSTIVNATNKMAQIDVVYQTTGN